MFIWATGPQENFPDKEMLLGQVNIKLKTLENENGKLMLFSQYKIILSNMEVGEVHTKILYRI